MDQPTAYELLKRIVALHRRQPGNPLAAAGHDDLGTALDPLQIVAQTVVKLPHTNFPLIRM